MHTSNRLRDVIRSDLWFSDGNIVLIAGNVAFKVHQGQLGRHSEVFNELFQLPQPLEQDLFENCFWVEVHDSPFDVCYFLRALYDGLYFTNSQAIDFPVIAAVLRLSSKYFVEHLRQRCLTQLQLDWPSTLEGWDQRELLVTDRKGYYSPRETLAHPTLVIELALDLGLDTLLPSAYYDLSRYGPSRILSGTDGPKLMNPLCSSGSPLLPSGNAAVEKRNTLSNSESQVFLSKEDLYRTLVGRELSQRYVAFFIDTQLVNRPHSPDCLNSQNKNGRHCRESFYYIMLNILRSVGGIATGRDGDVLFTLTQALQMLDRTDFSDGRTTTGLKICGKCKTDFAASVHAAREEVWGLIPGWFGMQAWKWEICEP